MLLHPRTLKHHVAASSGGRYALNTIALTSMGVLSTDGHSLLLVPYPDADPKSAPKIEGVHAESPAPQAEPVLVALDDAAKAAAMVSKSRRNASPYTELLQVETDGDSIRFGATDLSAAQTMQVRQPEGAYPRVAGVIPDYTKAQAVTINIDTLLRSLKALKGVTQDEVVTLRIIDDQQAVGFSCKDGTAMLCMPIQVEKPEEHVPDQLAKLRGDGPGVAAPAAPEEGEDGGTEEASAPTETEMQEAQDVFESQPVIPQAAEPTPAPAATSKPKKYSRRKQVTAPANELADIIGG